MKLIVLVDNNTLIDQYFLAEPAVSYYIEDGNERILFDTGYSDVLIHNANKLHIDLNQVTKIVFSHGHNDHTGGFQFLKNQCDLSHVELIAHPDAFRPKKEKDEYISSNLTEEMVNRSCTLTLSKLPIAISENIVFLGEVPQMNSFEVRAPIGRQEIGYNQYDDYVLDDSALVYKGEDGLFIITGCSHSGICNIIEYAKKVCNNRNVLGVIGGFHLFDLDSRSKSTIQYFLDSNISKLYPCHCVSFKVKAEINSHIPIDEVGVGLSINI